MKRSPTRRMREKGRNLRQAESNESVEEERGKVAVEEVRTSAFTGAQGEVSSDGQRGANVREGYTERTPEVEILFQCSTLGFAVINRGSVCGGCPDAADFLPAADLVGLLHG